MKKTETPGWKPYCKPERRKLLNSLLGRKSSSIYFKWKHKLDTQGLSASTIATNMHTFAIWHLAKFKQSPTCHPGKCSYPEKVPADGRGIPWCLDRGNAFSIDKIAVSTGIVWAAADGTSSHATAQEYSIMQLYVQGSPVRTLISQAHLSCTFSLDQTMISTKRSLSRKTQLTRL